MSILRSGDTGLKAGVNENPNLNLVINRATAARSFLVTESEELHYEFQLPLPLPAMPAPVHILPMIPPMNDRTDNHISFH